MTHITEEEWAAVRERFPEGSQIRMPSGETGLLNFIDAGNVADYATDAMRWAVSAGLIRGYSDGTVRPTATASRAEVAVIMQRFCQNMK